MKPLSKANATPGLVIGILLLLKILIGNESAHAQPQYSTNFFTSVTQSSIPFQSSINNKAQWLFYPSDFANAPSGNITKIYFRAAPSMLPVVCDFTGFTIKMGMTNLSVIPPGPWITANMNTVFSASSFQVYPLPSDWMPVTLQTSFSYNNLQHFIVEASQASYSVGFGIVQGGFTARSIYGNISSLMGNTQNFLVDFGFDIGTGSTDASLEGFTGIEDTICSGFQPVSVTLRNNGPVILTSTTIHMMINNLMQPPVSWTGSLAVNATSNVTLGSYTFMQGVNYNLEAFVSNPNGAVDTINSNDTVYKAGMIVMPTPQITLTDTAKVICLGDTVTIGGTLTGSPPWNLVVSDGTANLPMANITNPVFSISLTPTSTKTYTIVSVADATGCENTTAPQVIVTVQTAPGATITPVGSTAACMGDSVTLMATIGLNFICEWLKDGIIIPGVSSYMLIVKQSGAYTVKVTNPVGCSSTSAPVNVVIHPLPAVFLGNDTNLALGAHIMLDAGAGFNSHNWSTGATSRTIMVDTTGHGMGIQTIWVEVKDNHYCSGHDTIKINFAKNPGIEEAFSDAAVRIIPNPTDGEFELHLERFPAGNITVQLFGPDGKLSYTKDFMLRHATEQISVDPGQISDGLFLLKITTDQGTLTRKVVIRK